MALWSLLQWMAGNRQGSDLLSVEWGPGLWWRAVLQVQSLGHPSGQAGIVLHLHWDSHCFPALPGCPKCKEKTCLEQEGRTITYKGWPYWVCRMCFTCVSSCTWVFRASLRKHFLPYFNPGPDPPERLQVSLSQSHTLCLQPSLRSFGPYGIYSLHCAMLCPD